MRYETGQILEIAGDLVVKDELQRRGEYEWLDVVGIPSRPSKIECNLFFATHSEGQEGWDNGFDRRPDQETPVVVMEYSAYYADQVKKLAELLPPNLAFLLNIYETHINKDSFGSKEEIFQAKLGIKKEATAGYVNQRLLTELGVEKPEGLDEFEVDWPVIKSNVLPPTLRTADLFTVGRLVTEKLGLNKCKLFQAFESFQPAEKRIIKVQFGKKEIYFHGETSGGARLWSWFETANGRAPWMFIEELNFADEDPDGFRVLLEKITASEKTVVLDTPNNREKLTVPAHFLGREEFSRCLKEKAEGYVVYHKALASRQTDFDPQRYLTDTWR